MRENQRFYWVSYINRLFSYLTILCVSHHLHKTLRSWLYVYKSHTDVCHCCLVFKPAMGLFANHDLICLLYNLSLSLQKNTLTKKKKNFEILNSNKA